MNRSLRIAVFVGTFPVVSETFIVRQIAGLFNLGHSVDIYADCRAEPNTPIPGEVEKHRLMDRATFMDMPPESAPWEIPVWPLTGRTWPPGAEKSVHNSIRFARVIPKLLSCLKSHPALTMSVLKPSEYGYQAKSLSALYRLAKLTSMRRQYDLLHAHFGPIGNSFRFARQLWKAPLIVSFHGYDFSTFPRKHGGDFYVKLFATADVITVNSEYTRLQVEKLGCPPSKIQKLPVGLDLAEFPFHERSPKSGEPIRLLTVGRLVDIKGYEFAIRGYAKLKQRHSSLCYDIVGDGPLRQKMEKLISELNLQNSVTLHGARESAVVRRMMDGAHIFLLASVSIDGDQEGQGLVLQEAQASGLPVIATQHGAFPEGVVAGESAFLVPERDPDAIAERLAFLIEHSETWPAMGQRGRKFVEQNYDIHKLNLQLAGIYEKAIESYQRTD
ncbi:MAG: colanic acid biosynthesis glycosyltransferase WcaL [Acidobacteria bacterium]|nr:MAG: colanic acid biosynthesis glycosyltransferase WcaL [Acidobacteriota bacterium]